MQNIDETEKYLKLYGEDSIQFLKENTNYGTLDGMKLLNEAAKSGKLNYTVSDNLATAMYKSISSKIDLIDFGTIPESKGDFTRIQGYDKLMEAIDVLKQMNHRMGNDSKEIGTVEGSIETMKRLKNDFVLGIAGENRFIMILYSSMSMYICQVIDCMMTQMVQFLASNETDVKKYIAKHKLESFKQECLANLAKFNKASTTREFNKIFDRDNNKEFLGLGSMLLAGIISIIPILRLIVTYQYEARISFAEHLKMLSSFIELNVYNLEGSNNVKIRKKQSEIAKRITGVADKLEIKFNKGSKAAKSEAKVDINKYTTMNVNGDNFLI